MSAQLTLFDRTQLWEMGATEKCVKGQRTCDACLGR